ncbi:MAG: hypothetical protein P8H93_04685 [Polaribacter sp.]|nr:hypothetical protein [Polaribacter sp.]
MPKAAPAALAAELPSPLPGEKPLWIVNEIPKLAFVSFNIF